MELKGKMALLTGAASGIGLECVKEFLKAGVSKCAILDINPTSGEKARNEIEAEHGRGRVMFLQCDVTSEANFEEAVKKVKDEFGSLDIFVNNAGLFRNESWEKIVQTNLHGTIIGTNLAIRHMGTDNGGHGGTVVNMASVLGLIPGTIDPIYTASKHGIIGYTRSMGSPVFLKRSGVKVMALCPGPTNTILLMHGIEDVEDDLKADLKKQMDDMGFQEPISVAKSMIEVLVSGKNGSIWTMFDRSTAMEIEEPNLKKLLKKDSDVVQENWSIS